MCFCAGDRRQLRGSAGYHPETGEPFLPDAERELAAPRSLDHDCQFRNDDALLAARRNVLVFPRGLRISVTGYPKCLLATTDGMPAFLRRLYDFSTWNATESFIIHLYILVFPNILEAL